MGEGSKDVVTRAYDVTRAAGGLHQLVDIRPSTVVPADHPFFVLQPKLKPAEAAEAVWQAYQNDPSCSGKTGYAHCTRLDTRDQESAPSLQLFTTDVRLGNLTIQGFLRPLIDPGLVEGENIKRLKDGIKELQRYERSGVIHLKGFYGPAAEVS